MSTSTVRRETGATPVEENVLNLLRKAIDELGEAETLRHLPGVGKTMLYRAAARLPLYPGSQLLVDAALPALRRRLGLSAAATSSFPTS